MCLSSAIQFDTVSFDLVAVDLFIVFDLKVGHNNRMYTVIRSRNTDIKKYDDSRIPRHHVWDKMSAIKNSFITLRNTLQFSFLFMSCRVWLLTYSSI